MNRFSLAGEAERGLRLTFAFFTCFSLSAAIAAPPWIAHYVPMGAAHSGGAAQALAVDASGNIFVVVGGVLSGQNQTCVFKLSPQGNQQAQVCFANAGLVAGAAVDPAGNLIIAGSTNTPASLQLVSPLISKTSEQAGFIIKFNSALTGIIFSTLVGGTVGGTIGASTYLSA